MKKILIILFLFITFLTSLIILFFNQAHNMSEKINKSYGECGLVQGGKQIQQCDKLENNKEKEEKKVKEKKINFNQEFLKNSEKFLGKKYQAYTLNDFKKKEKVFENFKTFDCFTYVDTVESLTRSSLNNTKYLDELKKVRYKNGEVSFWNRNHYFTDWIENNNYEDVGQKIAEKKAVKVFKTLNKKNNKKVLESYFRPRSFYYIPAKNFDEKIISKIRSGDLGGFYSKLNWLDVSHTGIFIWKNNILYFRNASSLKGNVVDIPLSEYLKKGKSFVILRRKENYVSDYEVIKKEVVFNNKNYLAIREFKKDYKK